MGKIIAYCRVGCHFSDNTIRLLNEVTNICKQFGSIIEFKINSVDNNEEDKQYAKNNASKLISLGTHNTFPIIIYETTDKKYLLIGGNSNLENIIQIAHNSNQYFNNITILTNYLASLNLNKGEKRLLCYLLSILKKININK